MGNSDACSLHTEAKKSNFFLPLTTSKMSPLRYIVAGFGSFWLVLLVLSVVLGCFGWFRVLVTTCHENSDPLKFKLFNSYHLNSFMVT